MRELLAYWRTNARSNSNDLTTQSGVILSWLRQREDEMAADLVAIPTENPPGNNYRACVDLLEIHLRQAGLDRKRLGPGISKDDAADFPESLLAIHGSGERALYFHGHYDVVPAQTSAQFQPPRKEHFLFGRGSSAMKGGIVAMLFALRALKQFEVNLNGKIGLMLVRRKKQVEWMAQPGLYEKDCLGATQLERYSLIGPFQDVFV